MERDKCVVVVMEFLYLYVCCMCLSPPFPETLAGWLAGSGGSAPRFVCLFGHCRRARHAHSLEPVRLAKRRHLTDQLLKVLYWNGLLRYGARRPPKRVSAAQRGPKRPPKRDSRARSAHSNCFGTALGAHRSGSARQIGRAHV